MPKPDNSPPSQPDLKPSSDRTPGGGPKRTDRNQPNTFFWYVLIGIIIIALVLSFTSHVHKGEELKFSEFYTEIEGGNGTFRGAPVFELKITPEYITFQNAPKSDNGSAEARTKETKYYYIPVVGLGSAVQARLTDRLVKNNIEFSLAKPPAEWETVAWVLMLSVTALILMVWVFRRVGGAGAAMTFGRSRGKMYAQEDIEVTFDQVAGINEAVEELREIVEFLRNPGKYQALGGRIPRGVLLVGPPGTGKTLLAKAVAGEAGVPFFSLSGSDFVEMFVGVGAARVRDMFGQATQRSPSIIFIDELDALGKVRGSGMPGGHDEREQTLNALLVEMDGFASDQSVIVMGATNRPETLDPALLRPGRFDRHVLVDRPDIRGREAILKVHVGKIKMDDDVDLHRLAKLTPGFVGADLANLVNEAALLAARKDNLRVTMDEFEEGIERVVAGLQKQTRIISDDEKQRVAYHECGHALVACTLPNTDPVHKISIIPRGLGALGYTMQLPEGDRQLVTQSELENRICVLLGGITAEEIIFKETSTGAQNDLERATDLAHRMVTEFGMSPKLGRVRYREAARSPFLGTTSIPFDHAHSEDTVREIDLEVKRIIEEASQTAHEILSSRREVLEHMSKELLERETMDAVQLARILDEHKTGPQIMPGTVKKTTEPIPSPADASDDSPIAAES